MACAPVALLLAIGGANAAPNTDMYDPDVRLNDGFFPPQMGNQLIVTSSCAPNGDLTQPSTITVAQRTSGVATIPGAFQGGWVQGNLTWQLQATIGPQTLAPVDEFWPFTIDGVPTGSHGLPTGALTAYQGEFAIDRSPFGSNAGEDIAGTVSLAPGDGNWGVCRTFSNEQTGSPRLGGFVTGSVHSIHAGVLTYTVTQGPAGLLGETGDTAATLMNSFATDAANPNDVRIATGHFRQEFGTTIPAGGSEGTSAGPGVAPVTVEPMPDVTLTFSDVTADGVTNVVQTTDAPALPGGFQLVGDGLFYEIKTTASFTPPITVCFPIAGLPQGATPEILHYESGAWVSLATTVTGDVACGQVNSLSPFAVGYTQSFDVSGPFHPVDARPVVNTMKAGRTVAVKFSLGGDFGLDIFATGYPRSEGGLCAGGTTDSVETTSTGASGLRYDSASGTYQYNWKTQGSWKGQCRTLILRFSDGQELQIDFRFT